MTEALIGLEWKRGAALCDRRAIVSWRPARAVAAEGKSPRTPPPRLPSHRATRRRIRRHSAQTAQRGTSPAKRPLWGRQGSNLR